ncbi:MAG: MarR family transcriptional regulator [Ketobacter sp.]|nr:MAG: MarR family transcriptional regulator [Ketobacter sp.]
MSAGAAGSKSGFSAEKLYSLFRKQSPDVVDNVALTDIEDMFSMPGFKVDDQLCQGLDVYYRAETRRLIRSPDNEAELRAFLDHIEHQDAIDEFSRIQTPQGMNYGAKWRCMGELVEDQMEVFESICAVKLMRRRHVPEILSYLARHLDSEVKQKDICASLKISKTHLSGLLGPMLEIGWIQRTRVGVSNHVSITHKGNAEYRRYVDAVQKLHTVMDAHMPVVPPQMESSQSVEHLAT